MEEYSAVADAINEANSLAEKTAGSRNSRASGGTRAGGRRGGGSAGSNRGITSAAAGSAAGVGAGARTNNHRGGERDSDTEGWGEGVSRRASGGGGGGGGGQAGSVAVRSRASGGRAGVAVAGATGGSGSSADSKDAASYTVARHVADFGNVVVGFTKTKAFRVANTGKLGPVSWSFNKNALAGSGYSIEPEKVVRLPEGASAAFSASFQARRVASDCMCSESTQQIFLCCIVFLVSGCTLHHLLL